MATVHFGLPAAAPVDIEVTTFSTSGKMVTRVPNVDAKTLAGKPLVVRAGAGTQTATGR